MTETMPKCWRLQSKPDLFCLGCGHGIALKQLGYAIDELKIQSKITFGIDIGCSLLAWNFYNLDTIETHHGRTTPVMVGYKLVKENRIVIAYMGDGGGYAIGLQSLLHTALRNNPITVILINNENYAMTGGQSAPTTMSGDKTTTAPEGKSKDLGPGFLGPELVRQIAGKKAYVARASVSQPEVVKRTIIAGLKNQIDNDNFSFIEILSTCPTNWKTNAAESFDKLSEAEKYYHLGEL